MKNKVITRIPVENKILIIRGHKVMMDSDLAELYGIEPFNLNKAVRRNLDRFPPDFMFQLSVKEFASLRFQIGISNIQGGRRYLPFVFTEQGIAMLSSILRSKRAIQVNIQIMRAFIKLKQWISRNEDLRKKISDLEKKYDKSFAIVFSAIQKLLDGPEKPIHIKGFN
jgi:phage regulator Rha-like protein